MVDVLCVCALFVCMHLERYSTVRMCLESVRTRVMRIRSITYSLSSTHSVAMSCHKTATALQQCKIVLALLPFC
jgi:hypothetical protein